MYAFFKILKKRLVREIPPLIFIISSFLLNILYYDRLKDGIDIQLGALSWLLTPESRSNIFSFSFLIFSLYLVFLAIDIFYNIFCKRKNFHCFHEIYVIFNLFVFVLLGLQFSTLMYHLEKAEYISTYFLPVATISFFSFIVLILRIILRSATRANFYR
jgi:heme A synthase